MTNEELKKKIAQIINDGIIHGEDNFGMPTSKTIENIADALIAAGIGDVSELKKHRVVVEKSLIPEDDNAYVLPNIPPTVKQLYSGEEVEKIVKERDEYKHRAEVAERDKYLYCRSLYNLACKYVVSEHISTITGADGKSYIAGQEFCALCVMAEEAEQAKKELQEERKDENI